MGSSVSDEALARLSSRSYEDAPFVKNEVEHELIYRIAEFKNIESDLEKYKRAMNDLSNQFMMMGPKY